MKRFKVVKNGYDQNEIDDYLFKLNDDYETKFREQKMRINELKRELAETKEQLNAFRDKNANISDALVVAVETAKQIESSSKNIYELEIKRIRTLYDKWKAFLDELMKKYPALQKKYDTKLLLKVFAEDIDNILKQNKKTIEQKEAVAVNLNDSIGSNTIGLRMLINKMSNVNRPILQSATEIETIKADTPIVRNEKPSEETLAIHQIEANFNEEQKRLQKDKIKPISDMKLDKNESFENLVDKFLKSDDEDYTNAYSKILLEKQKNDVFDLKEAVTPTEDLDEIMKAFSFYPENDKDE